MLDNKLSFLTHSIPTFHFSLNYSMIILISTYVALILLLTRFLCASMYLLLKCQANEIERMDLVGTVDGCDAIIGKASSCHTASLFCCFSPISYTPSSYTLTFAQFPLLFFLFCCFLFLPLLLPTPSFTFSFTCTIPSYALLSS